MNNEMHKKLVELQGFFDKNKEGLDYAAKAGKLEEILKKQILPQNLSVPSTLVGKSIIEQEESRRAFIAANFSNLQLESIAEESARQQSYIRSTIGPLKELQKLGAFNNSSAIGQATEQLYKATIVYEERFRMPDLGEVDRFATSLTAMPSPSAVAILQQFAPESVSLKHAMEAMHTPWIDSVEVAQSISGFAGLQSIGHLLASGSPFGTSVTEALRAGLGDWRDKITWPEPIFTDVSTRADFYVEKGFDPALTSFPPAAFRESIDIAGLGGEPPALIDGYGTLIVPAEDNEEVGLIRTNNAHNWLQRLERQLRRFIDAKMTAKYGPDWPKSKTNNGVYDAWIEKKRKEQQKAHTELPLIAYADFTDYENIICRSDNWKAVFAPFFGRTESVRESFQRLHPIRIITMHARIISQDDETYLYAEVTRIMRAISTSL